MKLFTALEARKATDIVKDKKFKAEMAEVMNEIQDSVNKGYTNTSTDYLGPKVKSTLEELGFIVSDKDNLSHFYSDKPIKVSWWTPEATKNKDHFKK